MACKEGQFDVVRYFRVTYLVTLHSTAQVNAFMHNIVDVV